MSFIVYDIIFLVAFLIFISIFLYTRKKNLKKEGLLLLYKANWGIKLINKVGKKYDKGLKKLGYVSIGIGYVLMGSMIYLLGKIVYIYAAFPSVIRAIKVPPITPLIPYLPQAFKLDFLPPFYFTYWIAILAIIAITHEFAHGIFAARDNIKIKATGFGFFPFFLPIFLAAFVEPDEKVMSKKSKYSQMAILSAGTFANVLTGILFFIVMIIFFKATFIASGVVFDNYAYDIVDVGKVITIGGIALQDKNYEGILSLVKEDKINIKTEEGEFILIKSMLESPQNRIFIEENNKLPVFYNSPAINAELEGAIQVMEYGEQKVRVRSLEDSLNFIDNLSPGDKINITTELEDKTKVIYFNVELSKNPETGEAWLGIVFINQQKSGIMGAIQNSLNLFKNPNIYYESRIGDFGIFIYNLLWWLIIISISVALINMLPVGIFDGGRFFYLTVWGLTKSERKAAQLFKFSTYLILFVFLLLMVFWAISFF